MATTKTKLKKRRRKYETILHPRHYHAGMMEHVDFAEDQGWGPGYHLGNCTKYLVRAGRKPGASALKDLQKGRWFLDRWIRYLQRGPKIWRVRPRRKR